MVLAWIANFNENLLYKSIEGTSPQQFYQFHLRTMRQYQTRRQTFALHLQQTKCRFIQPRRQSTAWAISSGDQWST